MNRKPLLAAAALAAGLALAAPALAGSAATPLAGTVGPGFTITLTKAGKPVKTLKPGAYKITVADKSNAHNFHILGPGVNKKITTVPFMGSESATVTLKKGKYTIQCDPHAAAGMKSHLQGRLTRGPSDAGGRSRRPRRVGLLTPGAVAYAPATCLTSPMSSCAESTSSPMSPTRICVRSPSPCGAGRSPRASGSSRRARAASASSSSRRGSAAVTHDGKLLATLGPGDHFGEIALLSGAERTATVSAATDVVVWGMPAWNFRPLVREQPSVTIKLLEGMARQLAGVPRDG